RVGGRGGGVGGPAASGRRYPGDRRCPGDRPHPGVAGRTGRGAALRTVEDTSYPGRYPRDWPNSFMTSGDTSGNRALDEINALLRRLVELAPSDLDLHQVGPRRSAEEIVAFEARHH